MLISDYSKGIIKKSLNLAAKGYIIINKPDFMWSKEEALSRQVITHIEYSLRQVYNCHRIKQWRTKCIVGTVPQQLQSRRSHALNVVLRPLVGRPTVGIVGNQPARMLNSADTVVQL
jgi:hypothetical protein